MNKPDFDLVQYQKNVISDMQEKLYCQVEENDRLLGIIDSLEDKARRLKLSLDNAVFQLHGICSACKSYSNYHQQGKCKDCRYDRWNIDAANDNWE